MTEFGKSAANIFAQYDLSDDMFYRKGQGIPGFIRNLESGSVREPNSYVREIEKSPPRWSTGKLFRGFRMLLSNGLE